MLKSGCICVEQASLEVRGRGRLITANLDLANKGKMKLPQLLPDFGESAFYNSQRMSSDLQFDGKGYISSRRAAELCGYTQDYVGQLIRNKKIDARRVGRSWFVSEESILAYHSAPENMLFKSISDKREALTGGRISDVSYALDDRALLPELKKPAAPLREVASRIALKAPMPSALMPHGIISVLGHKIAAAAIAFSVVVGMLWFSDADRARATWGAVVQTASDFHRGVRVALDGYVAGLEKTGSDIAGGVLAVSDLMGAQSRESDAFASVAASDSGAATGFLEKIFEGIYRALSSLFEDEQEIAVAEAEPVPVAPIIRTVAQQKPSPVAEIDPPAATHATTVVQVIERVVTESDGADAEARAEIDRLAAALDITIQNVRNARYQAPQAASVKNISGSAISDSTLTGSTMTGSTISGSQITASTIDTSAATTTSLYSDVITAGSLTANNITFASSNVTDGTTTNATSTTFFSSVLRATSGVIDAFSSAVATIGNLFATNATTTNLAATNLSVFTAPVAPAFTATSSSATSTFAGDALFSRSVGIGSTSPTALLSIQGTQPAAAATANAGVSGAYIKGGQGGDSTINFGSGGVGGALYFEGGQGGSNIAGGSFGLAGAGGVVNIIGGRGGEQTGSSNNFPGLGGNVEITGGASGTGGLTRGGAVVLNGGQGSISTLAGYISLANTRGTVSVGPHAVLPQQFQLSVRSTGTQDPFEVASSTGDSFFRITADGKVGIGTTSPYAMLSVAGQVVAEHFTATSTNATSTFSGNVVMGGASPVAASSTVLTIKTLSANKATGIDVEYWASGSGAFSTTTGISLYGNPGGSSKSAVGISNTMDGFYQTTKIGMRNLFTGLPYLNAVSVGYENRLSNVERGTFYGMRNIVDSSLTGGWWDTTNAYGVYNDMGMGNANATNNTYGTYTIGHTYTGGTKTFYGNYVTSASDSTGGTQYGVYVDLTPGTATKYAAILNGGNVGVGTTSPSSRLSVSGSGAGVAQLTVDPGSNGSNRGLFQVGSNASFGNILAVSLNGDLTDAGLTGLFGGGQSNVYLQAAAGGDAIVRTNGNSERLRVTSAGDVGIGAASPLAQLSLTKGQSLGTQTLAQMSFGFNGTTDYSHYIHTQHNGGGASGNALNFFTSDGTQSGVFPTNGVFGLSVSNGRIGVGVVPSQGKIHLTGGDSAGVFSSPSIALGFSTTGEYAQYIHTRHNSIATGNAIDFYTSDGTNNGTFPTNAIHGMSIVNGSVGIGTTDPQRLLHVYRSTDGAPVRFEDANGYCEIDPTSTTWTCTSDRSLKKDISSLESQDMVSRIAGLNAVSFRWNKDSDADPLRYGFIAQDVESVFPELVITADNGLKSVMYGGFTPFIVEAIKELKLAIDNVTGRVDALEARVAALERFAETGSFATTSSAVAATTSASTTVEQVQGWLASLGASIESAVARFVTVIADAVTTKRLTVGDPGNVAATGITVFDRLTGSPACIFVSNGVLRSEAGECGVASQPSGASTGGSSGGSSGDSQPQATQDGGSTEQGTTTPDGTDTATPDGGGSAPSEEPAPIVDPAPEPTPEPAAEPAQEPPAETAPGPAPEPAPEVAAEAPAA